MFNSTIVGQPYKRISKIVIDYPSALTANVTFVEQEHVLLADGSHRSIGAENAVSFTITPSKLEDTVALTDINTGELLGASMSYGQIMLGILAAIREHQ